MKRISMILAAVAVIGLGADVELAVKVKAQFNEKVDFSRMRTWAWNDKGAGDVKMARTADDDPAIVRQRAEPIIKEEVAAELPKRGLTASTGAASDVEITYYVLITVGTQSQQIGQFLPAVAQWGLPPFTGATQSYRVIEQGSLVLDISANDEVIWRGIGQAELKPGQPQEKRAALLRDAVREILKHYPPKKK